MFIRHSHLPLVAAAGLAAALTLAACSPERTTSADGRLAAAASAVGKVDLCHFDAATGAIISVGSPALGAHLAHGDYVSTLLVNRGDVQAGDGVHFTTVGAALDAARAARLAHGELTEAACRITIRVAAGDYPGSASAPASAKAEHFPLIVDVPDISLLGALAMTLDGNGRATGQGDGSGETAFVPSEPLPIVTEASTPIIAANGHPDGSAGHGLVVQGFVFRSGHSGVGTDAGGQGVLALRVNGLTIRGNRFEPGFTESIDLRASSGEVLENHLSGTAGTCDVCLAGPGRYRAAGNRLLAGGIPGLGTSGVVGLPVPAGVEPFALPATAETWAEIVNNSVQDHRRVPVGVGVRVDAVGVRAPNVQNLIHATIRDNRIENNRFGIIVHAAFPVAGTLLRSDVDVTLGGNEIVGSCQAKLLVSLSRHTTALGLSNNPWLRNSTFRLDLAGNLPWDEAWYGHPAGFGNTLIVDGAEIPNGTRQFYSETSCPAQP